MLDSDEYSGKKLKEERENESQSKRHKFANLNMWKERASLKELLRKGFFNEI